MAKRNKKNSTEDDSSGYLSDEGTGPRILKIILPKVQYDEPEILDEVWKEKKVSITAKKKSPRLLGYPQTNYSLEKETEDWSWLRHALHQRPRFEPLLPTSPRRKVSPNHVDSSLRVQGQWLYRPTLSNPKPKEVKERLDDRMESIARLLPRVSGELAILKAKRRREGQRKKKNTKIFCDDDVRQTLICVRLNDRSLQSIEHQTVHSNVGPRQHIHVQHYFKETPLHIESYFGMDEKKLPPVRAPPSTPTDSCTNREATTTNTPDKLPIPKRHSIKLPQINETKFLTASSTTSHSAADFDRI
ncbi:unnamed protein product [Dimorphilus gyrociliatus]|uniref:Uncharacterized protein n=1 Tax=Dimorphilus gyrociliatus TaxID=2664684 RepID=A0A7I8VR75_9ANNE|nr:unnamed protein product [Dimorphilus gyrociliatus]